MCRMFLRADYLKALPCLIKQSIHRHAYLTLILKLQTHTRCTSTYVCISRIMPQKKATSGMAKQSKSVMSNLVTKSYLRIVHNNRHTPRTSMESITDDALAMLTAMGFDAETAQVALLQVNGSVQRAADLLLSGSVRVGDSAPANASSTTPATVIEGTQSQYSFEEGRSACTCLALSSAAALLDAQPNDATSLFTPKWIDEQLSAGIAVYRQHFGGQAVEHLSAEEALPFYPQLRLLPDQTGSNIRQGVRSHDPSHPQGLSRLLYECQPTSGAWASVIMTKTPETVCLALSPAGPCLLMDSHPRPPSTTKASVKICANMEALLEELQTVFPVVDLGDDIPELMAAMYNAFDLYVVEKK